MLDFIIFLNGLLIGQFLYSLKDYNGYDSVYKMMNFMKFEKYNNLLIANLNTKDEFVIISDWNFKISPKYLLQFDIWTLIDFHKLYWIIKFHIKASKMGLLNK